MNTEKEQKLKSLSFVILVIIGLYLLSNTNNNLNPIIQRIFRPIHIGSSTIYYAALFPILLIYYSLKAIYNQTGCRFLSTRFRRIIAMWLLLSILPKCSENGTKLYKSFYTDLNSIYCYRDHMNLAVKTEKAGRQMVSILELENCSSKSQEFYVKVNVSSYFKDMQKPTLVSRDTITLKAKERRQLEIALLESSADTINIIHNGSINRFEFSLFDDLQEIRFIQKD